MKNKLTIFPLLLGLLLFAGSCRKEVLEPSRIEPPRFYVESEMQGKPVQIYSGKGEFVTVPNLEKVSLLGATLSLFSSNFTNGTDSFRVGFMSVQPPWIAPVTPQEELRRTLENASYNPETLFSDLGGVGINWKVGDKTYTSPADAELQDGSYFRISKIEDYPPPGADHAMKKLDVTFRCYMQNYDNPDDNFWLENGKATLLLDYEEK